MASGGNLIRVTVPEIYLEELRKTSKNFKLIGGVLTET
jgi:hypothetical protein